MRRRTAYTLLELMLVIAIIVVASAVSYPTVESMYSGVRLKAASDSVRTAWANARTWAINDTQPYRFAIVPNTGKFRVAPDHADFWSGGSTDGMNGSVMEDSLPRGIRFTDASGSGDDDGNSAAGTDSGSGDWMTVVTFLPTGTADEDVQISFQYGSGKPTVLRLRGLTGTIMSGQTTDR